MKTNMLAIEGKTKIVAEKVRIKEENAKLIGEKINKDTEDETIKKLQEKDIINLEEKDSEYYKLNNSDLNALGLENVKLSEGFYIVEYHANEIIYSNGMIDKSGNVKYKLSELLEVPNEETEKENNEINVEDVNSEIKNEEESE